MAELDVITDYNAVGALLKSDEVRTLVKQLADDTALLCGSAYESDLHEMGQRPIASVFTTDADAIEDNRQNLTILKVMGV